MFYASVEHMERIHSDIADFFLIVLISYLTHVLLYDGVIKDGRKCTMSNNSVSYNTYKNIRTN